MGRARELKVLVYSSETAFATYDNNNDSDNLIWIVSQINALYAKSLYPGGKT